jgi:RNA recognition motif-containing protein
MMTANALTELALKCRIYVGSLPYEGVTEDDIRAAFSPFGIILNINHCLVCIFF